MRIRLLSTLLVIVTIAGLNAADSPNGTGKNPAPVAAEAKRTAAPGDDELRKLLIDRYNVVLLETKDRYAMLVGGAFPTDSIPLIVDAGNRLLRSELDLCETPADRVRGYEKHVALTHYFAVKMQEREQAGLVSRADAGHAKYARLDAEIQLLKAKRDSAKK